MTGDNGAAGGATPASASSTDDRAAGSEDRSKLDVALSGGGHRSALFGLGALYYLVRSGRIREVETIASVSGGSYTNARALLCEEDLRTITADGFVDHFRPFVNGMTRRGWPVIGALGAWLLAPFALGGALWAVDWAWWCEAVIIVVAVILAVGLLPWIGRLMAATIWTRLFGWEHRRAPLGPSRPQEVIELGPSGRPVGSRRVRRRPAEPVATDTPDDDKILHVFCATELGHSTFLYMTNKGVWHDRFLHGSHGEITLKTAVDASAALPPIFAPVKVGTSMFFAPPQDTPAFVLCVDGGVHDTLATEWFRARLSADHLAGRFDDDHLAGAPAEPDERRHWILVVDGTAPQRNRPYLNGTRIPLTSKRIPLAWWMSGHRRSLQLVIGNWDRRNFADIQEDPNDDFVGISVGDSPYTGAPPSEAQVEALVRSPVDWRKLVEHGSQVGAVPRRLDPDTAITLIYHGYVMAWRALTAPHVFDDAETQELLGFDAFEREWGLDGG